MADPSKMHLYPLPGSLVEHEMGQVRSTHRGGIGELLGGGVALDPVLVHVEPLEVSSVQQTSNVVSGPVVEARRVVEEVEVALKYFGAEFESSFGAVEGLFDPLALSCRTARTASAWSSRSGHTLEDRSIRRRSLGLV